MVSWEHLFAAYDQLAVSPPTTVRIDGGSGDSAGVGWVIVGLVAIAVLAIWFMFWCAATIIRMLFGLLRLLLRL